RHLADDRRARGAVVFPPGPRRGVRFARRGAAPQRGRAVAAPAGPLRASRPHHAHRVGARGARSRDHRGVRRRERERPGAGAGARPGGSTGGRRRRGTVARRGGGGSVTTTTPWRSLRNISGPFAARLTDIDPLNRVFSDAFTERYRRDGMVG